MTEEISTLLCDLYIVVPPSINLCFDRLCVWMIVDGNPEHSSKLACLCNVSAAPVLFGTDALSTGPTGSLPPATRLQVNRGYNWSNLSCKGCLSLHDFALLYFCVKCSFHMKLEFLFPSKMLLENEIILGNLFFQYV